VTDFDAVMVTLQVAPETAWQPLQPMKMERNPGVALRGHNEAKKIGYNIYAAGIPSQEIADRLLRYEAHLSREIDRILNRLERLQRIRKGQPLPPQLDVKIS
jgi:hypothetical protein